MLTVRLANNQRDLMAAQSLRYRVFYQELSARPDSGMLASKRDFDCFDEICDHLIVVRCTREPESDAITTSDGEVVGTYRLLRQDAAIAAGGFYSQREFNLQPLLHARPKLDFIELGRSCVLAQYRTKPVIELLWQGIWDYVRTHNLDVMLGCASIPGTCPDQLAVPLSYLSHNFHAPREWQVLAHQRLYVPMNRLPPGHYDDKLALRALPPLIKAYLRVGAFVGEGAVIDHQFNTTDVLIILPVDKISPRYFNRFGLPHQTGIQSAQPLMS